MKLIVKSSVFVLIFVLSSVSTFAFIVSAPAVEAQLGILNGHTVANHSAEIAKWTQSIAKAVQIYNTAVRQVQETQRMIEQGKTQFDHWKKLSGNWQGIASLIRTGAAQFALEQGTFCGTPNMGAGDLFPGESSVQGLAHAVEEAKKLMAGHDSRMTPQDLRNVVIRIIGRIPESEAAGVSTFAQTAIEDDMAFLGRTNKAITDLQSEKRRIRQEREGKLRGGLFTEADKSQYEMAESDIGSQIQALQLQTLMRVNQQLMVANSFRVKAQNDVESRRNEEHNLRQASSAFLGN